MAAATASYHGSVVSRRLSLSLFGKLPLERVYVVVVVVVEDPVVYAIDSSCINKP